MQDSEDSQLEQQQEHLQDDISSIRTNNCALNIQLIPRCNESDPLLETPSNFCIQKNQFINEMLAKPKKEKKKKQCQNASFNA